MKALIWKSNCKDYKYIKVRFFPRPKVSRYIFFMIHSFYRTICRVKFKTKQIIIIHKKKKRLEVSKVFFLIFCLFFEEKMQITVTTLSGDVFPLEVPEDLELENFKAFCEAESGIASQEMIILFNGKT